MTGSKTAPRQCRTFPKLPFVWELSPVCYLEDLFVGPGQRAAGVGEALIDWLVAAMGQHGWSRIYWMTKENNYCARGLYDKYNPRDAFVRYVVKPK